MLRSVITIAGLALGVFGASDAMADRESICGEDNRTPSKVVQVGRLRQETAGGGCTVTMIGRVCAITAGHCRGTFGIAEFNTPPSQGGNIQASASEDMYKVDLESVTAVNGGPGNDWAVLRLKKNRITGRYAGDVQGMWEVEFDAVVAKYDNLTITGYGLDRDEPTRNLAQQTHSEQVYQVSGTTLRHTVDTMGGNSGSSVINSQTGKIVGIHTHGGCYSWGGSNQSTLIATHSKLKESIKSCLQWEKDNL